MARSILQHVNGFTPVIDVVVQDVGLTTAAVYGIHWRYCQLHDHVSRASMDVVGARLGISAKTARRHTHKLCGRGYLEDLTPDRRHAPHVYRDTGRVVIEGLLEARLDRESNLDPPRLDRESNQVRHSDQPRLDRESNKDSSSKIEERERGKRELASLWNAIRKSLLGIMDRATYETHFARGTPVALHHSTLTVSLPNPRSIPAIQRLNGRITNAIQQQHGISLSFVAHPPPP